MRKIISNNTELTLEKDEFGGVYLTGTFYLSEDDPQFKDFHNPKIRDEVLAEVIWDDQNVAFVESNDDVNWDEYKVYINGVYAGNQDDFGIVGDFHW